MNPKDVENLRRYYGYYQGVSEGQPYVPWEDWETTVWEYVKKLEKEVLSLRKCIEEHRSSHSASARG
jgi:hypothetical protein